MTRLASTHYGSLLLTGYWSPVTQQPVKNREAIIKSWSQSRLPSLRMLAKALVTTAHKAHAMSSPYFGSLSGYTDVPVHRLGPDRIIDHFDELYGAVQALVRPVAA